VSTAVVAGQTGSVNLKSNGQSKPPVAPAGQSEAADADVQLAHHAGPTIFEVIWKLRRQPSLV